MQAPESAAERQQLLRMAPRLARKLGHAKPPPELAQPQRIDLQLPPPAIATTSNSWCATTCISDERRSTTSKTR
jgi:hypothetical protein